MLRIGASIEPILGHMPPTAARTFLEALQFSARSEFERAIDSLSGLSKQFSPLPAVVLNRICIDAHNAGTMELFDSTARMIVAGDIEIIDLRAARLKRLQRGEELNQLVLAALNADEESASAWLAFSRLLELDNDGPLALQATLKALPQVRRREIAGLAFGRLVEDVEGLRSPWPEHPASEAQLNAELARLAEALHVDCDLNSHDGHRFHYLCDKLFADVFRSAVPVPDAVAPRLARGADRRAVLDAAVMQGIERDLLAESMVEQFSVVGAEGIMNIIAIIIARRSPGSRLTREKVMSMLKMPLCLCPHSPQPGCRLQWARCP